MRKFMFLILSIFAIIAGCGTNADSLTQKSHGQGSYDGEAEPVSAIPSITYNGKVYYSHEVFMEKPTDLI